MSNNETIKFNDENLIIILDALLRGHKALIDTDTTFAGALVVQTMLIGSRYEKVLRGLQMYANENPKTEFGKCFIANEEKVKQILD